MNQYDYLSDYLFLRCFSNKEHMDAFLSGKSVYMNSVKRFWEIENDFQGDPYDCSIIPIINKAKWSMWVGNDRPQVKIQDLTEFSLGIQGYLYCVFAVPKAFFLVKDNQLCYDEENAIKNDFFLFLEEYYNKIGRAYVCAFDARFFMLRLTERLQEKGQQYVSGFVSYRDCTQEERIKWFNERRIKDIVFTKQENYNYQHEYRIVVTNDTSEGHIEIQNVSMDNIVFFSCEYNSPRQLNQNKLKGK